MRCCAGIVLAGLVVAGCGTSISVRTTEDDTLRVALPPDWKLTTGHQAVRVQEYLAHRTVWLVGGSGEQPADLIAIHEVDTAPRPGTDVSIQRERALIEDGRQTYLAQPEAIGDFAQSNGHSCFTGFHAKQPVRWEQQGLIGLALEWTCVAQVPVKGWAIIAFDPAGVQHRFVITATPDYWDAHTTQIDAARRSLAATASPPH
ncbi:hypothetical protein AZH51_14510 [Branchiibius sp. NY16-3462-2]|nr:hypothetical protein AZH51_14510 [Branchiibius sp. NY16-3462-2]